jgi:hypothetical protein
MADGRVRDRKMAPQTGVFTQVASPTIVSNRDDDYTYRSRCIDVFPLRDQNFTVEHSYVEGHLLNRLYYYALPDLSRYRHAVNFPMRLFTSGGNAAHQDDSARPSNSFLAVKVLAATNPSKPVIDLPVSLLELRELPHLLKTTGDTLIKTFAKNNLNREFGLTPLMSDAIGLMEFTKHTKKRVELFKQLREKPLCRKATLYESTITTEPGTIVPTNSAPSQCQVNHVFKTYTTQRTVWGYVTWTPDSVFNKQNMEYNDPALEFLAKRAVLGTQLGLVTAWNAIPWTWLIDWFGNTGDWLEANRHVVPARPSTPRICETIRTQQFYVSNGVGTMGLQPGEMPITSHLVTKKRSLASATLPSAYLPLLTERQVGILASLAILRS